MFLFRVAFVVTATTSILWEFTDVSFLHFVVEVHIVHLPVLAGFAANVLLIVLTIISQRGKDVL